MYRPTTGMTLHGAVLTPNPVNLQLILQRISEIDSEERRKALLNAQDEHGYTPLTYAVWTRCSSYVDLLLNAGADPNVKNRNGATPLHMFIHSRAGSIMGEPHKNYDEVPEQINPLLRPNQNFIDHVMNTLHQERWTDILHYHTQEIPLSLIRAGADVSVLDNYGYSFTSLLEDVIDRIQVMMGSDEHKRAMALFDQAFEEFDGIRKSCRVEITKQRPENR